MSAIHLRRLRHGAAALLVIALALGQATIATAAPTETFRGRYVLAHSDDFADAEATFTPAIELENGTVLGLDFRGRSRPDLTPGAEIRVQGSRVGREIMVADGGTEALSEGTVVLPAGVTKRVAVILFNFANDTAQPYTPAHANGVAFTNANSVAAYYDESSWGQLTLTGDVFGWYTIAHDNTGCAYSTWANAASSAATSAGVNLNAYDYVTFAFPRANSCGWAGLASMPGRNAWLNGSSAMGLRVFAHELGHNFGTHHANTLDCVVDGVRLSLTADLSGCTSFEYGDPFTVMGAAARYQPTNVSRGNFGWLESENTRTVTATGTYTLTPIELDGPGDVRVLRVERAANSYLTLEFRQPFGTQFDTFAPTVPVVNGVTVRVAAGYSTRTQTQLVDATPGTSTFDDAALAVGATLVDPSTGVEVTTLGVGATGATVRISFGDEPEDDTTAPTRPAKPKLHLVRKKVVALHWEASDDDVEVTGYHVYRGDKKVATVTRLTYRDRLPGAAMTPSYSVVAFDDAGNLSRRSRRAHLRR